MTTLNARYDYGLDLVLLSVDEGIAGYRDDSLEVRERLGQACVGVGAARDWANREHRGVLGPCTRPSVWVV
jgi:hypothetical protein